MTGHLKCFWPLLNACCVLYSPVVKQRSATGVLTRLP